MKEKNNIPKDFLIIIVGMILFWFLSFPFLKYPPLANDEVYIAILTSNLINFHPVSMLYKFQSYILTNSGHFFPIMTNAYVGTSKAYLYYPFLLIGGVNQESFRIGSLFYSSVLLIVIYFWVKGWFGRKVAFINHLLLSTNIVFVQFARLAMPREEIYQLLWFFISLILFWKYYISNRKIFLFLGMFVVGIGLSDKLMFLWFIFAVVVSSLIIKPARDFIKRILDLKFSEFLTMILCFSVGFFPYLYALFSSKGKFIVDLITKSKLFPSITLDNLFFHVGKIVKLLSADIVSNKDTVFYIYLKSPKDYFTISFFIFLLVSILFIVGNKKLKTDLKLFLNYKWLWCFFVVLNIWFLSFFNFDRLNLGYTFLLLPFILCFFSIVSVFLINILRKNKTDFIVVFILISYLLSNIFISFKFQNFYKNNLNNTASSAFSDIRYFLQSYKVKRPIILKGSNVEIDANKDAICLWHLKQLILMISDFKVVPEIVSFEEIAGLDKYQQYIDGDYIYLLDDSHKLLKSQLNELCFKRKLKINYLKFFDDGVKRFVFFKIIK